MKKIYFLLLVLLWVASVHATAPTLNSVGLSSNSVTAGSDINFTATADTSIEGSGFKLYVCRGVGSESCADNWCISDFNGTATTAQCTYTTTGDTGTKDYNALICDTNHECSSAMRGSFTVNSVPATDTNAPPGRFAPERSPTASQP